MAWRVPRFAYLHALRDAGASAITGLNDFHADFPKTRLIDERSSVNTKFNASASDHYIQVDRGSPTRTGINRLFIPSGHNFTLTTNLRLRADGDAAMSTPTTLIDDTVLYGETGGGKFVGTGDIDIPFTLNSERYVRLDWPSQTDQWELPELWLSQTVWPLTRGPEPNWTDQKIDNAVSIPKSSGESPVIVLGAKQREFILNYARGDTQDSAVLEIVFNAVGLSRPFIFDPPYDDEAAVVVKFVESMRVTWDHPVPTAAVKTKRFTMHLLESLE
jgi:hypothetical protein